MARAIVRAASLAYNTTKQTITGQIPFFATFQPEANLPVHWIHPVPKADLEMELSDWTETIQEQYVEMLNTTTHKCQSLKLESGSGILIRILFLEAVIS